MDPKKLDTGSLGQRRPRLRRLRKLSVRAHPATENLSVSEVKLGERRLSREPQW